MSARVWRGAVAAVVLGLATMTAAGPAMASGASASADARPLAWEYIGSFVNEVYCLAAGEQGLAEGDWDDYYCEGIEGNYNLYAYI